MRMSSWLNIQLDIKLVIQNDKVRMRMSSYLTIQLVIQNDWVRKRMSGWLDFQLDIQLVIQIITKSACITF